MSDNTTRTEVEAMISAAEARTDTKLNKMDAQFTRVLDRLDDIKRGQGANRVHTWVVGGVIVAMLGGIAATAVTMAPTAFEMGSNFSSTVRSQVEEHHKALDQADVRQRESVVPPSNEQSAPIGTSANPEISVQSSANSPQINR